MSRCLRQILTSSRPKHTHTDIRYTHSHTKSHHTFFPSKQKLGTFTHTSPPITHVSHTSKSHELPFVGSKRMVQFFNKRFLPFFHTQPWKISRWDHISLPAHITLFFWRQRKKEQASSQIDGGSINDLPEPRSRKLPASSRVSRGTNHSTGNYYVRENLQFSQIQNCSMMILIEWFWQSEKWFNISNDWVK